MIQFIYKCFARTAGKILVLIIGIVCLCFFISFSSVNFKIQNISFKWETSQTSPWQHRKSHHINSPIWYSDPELRDRVMGLILRRARAKDPELVAFIKEILDPPSDHGIVKMSGGFIETPQAKAAWKLLQNQESGFFVECGALDGETSSNTLYLEQRRGWRGLLVEMDPHFYTQMLGKARKSYSLNACLSPLDRVVQLQYEESRGGLGHLLTSVKDKSRSNRTQTSICFPLESVLLALGRTSVDYLSLDVEGKEMDILRTIPFNHGVNIKVVSLEYLHGGLNQSKYRAFFGNHGYHLYQDVHVTTWYSARTGFAQDYVFVRDDIHKQHRPTVIR